MFECSICKDDYDEDQMFEDDLMSELPPMCIYCAWDIQDGIDLYDE